MSYVDGFYLIVFFAVFIVIFTTASFIYNAIYPSITPTSASVMANTNIKRIETFYGASLPALIIIISIISVLLTSYLLTNPILLIIFLLINVACLLVYDIMDAYLQSFAGSSLNTGVLNTAIDFYHTGYPKWIILSNMLMTIVMLGKRAFGGSNS